MPEAFSSYSDSLRNDAAQDSASAPVAREKFRWVPETRFGHWFLGTNVWSRYVVQVALNELAGLLPPESRRPQRILDAGCGPGVSLPLLDRLFQPESILGLDIDPREVARARRQVPRCQATVEIRRGDATRLELADHSIDLVLCHQLLHHVVQQEQVLAELYRVLAPGGALLVAESCREFIHSTPVRLLFRHPNEVQRTAGEYQQLVRRAGFEFAPHHVVASTPFWSRPDWGLRRRLGWTRAQPDAEPTEINLVAFKPR